MSYRVGRPGWKLAARLGATLSFRVMVRLDEESKTYWADSPDLDGLVVSGQTLDELRSEAVSAAGSLLEFALDGGHPKATANITMRSPVHCAA